MNQSKSTLIRDFKKLFTKAQETQQKARDAIKSFDRTMEKAKEASNKTKELLNNAPSNQ